jgi:hypothetical protein
MQRNMKIFLNEAIFLKRNRKIAENDRVYSHITIEEYTHRLIILFNVQKSQHRILHELRIHRRCESTPKCARASLPKY